MRGNIEKRERTKEALINSLMSLCVRKGYYRTTINDICINANVTRSTFYRYFNDKDMMLRDIENEYIDNLTKLSSDIYKMDFGKVLSDPQTYSKSFNALWSYLSQTSEVCTFLLSDSGDPYFKRKITEQITDVFNVVLKKNNMNFGDIHEYVVGFCVSGIIDTICKFTAKQDVRVEKITTFLLEAAGYLPMKYNSAR